jgi:hypothetical protein
MTLVKIGLLSHSMMKETRSYAILAIFVIAAVITPTPDMMTLSLLAVPMVILYEICIWLSYFHEKKLNRMEAEEEEQRMKRLLADPSSDESNESSNDELSTEHSDQSFDQTDQEEEYFDYHHDPHHHDDHYYDHEEDSSYDPLEDQPDITTNETVKQEQIAETVHNEDPDSTSQEEKNSDLDEKKDHE